MAGSLSLANQELMVDNKKSHFKAMFPYIFADYQNPPLTGDVAKANKAWQIWQNTHFSWWRCQLNFALWRVSAGCGFSFASLYRFHVYYTTKCLLEELSVALLGDKSHSWYDNPYNLRAYKRLCSEFGVSPDTDWWQRLDHGLGVLSTNMTPSGAYRHAHVAQGPFCHPQDAMRLNLDISGAWTSLFFTNQRASRKRVWGVLLARSAHMFGLSWERNPRRGRIFARPGRDLTPRNHFW